MGTALPQRQRMPEPVWLARTLATPAFAVAIILVLCIFLYGSIVGQMAARWWDDPAASHGMLVPPLALLMAWRRRAMVSAMPAVPDSRGVWTVLIACLMFLVGKLGAGYFMSTVSMLVLVGGLIQTFWGRKRLRALLFPLCFAAAMIPPPSALYINFSFPLQILASDISARLAQWMGVTLYREGNQIYLAQVRLGVAEACSGLHSLPALMIAAVLLGTIYCRGLYRRAALLLAAIPIAIAANVTRITSTACLADWQPELARGAYHAASGMLVFLGGFGLLWVSAKALGGLPRWRRT